LRRPRSCTLQEPQIERREHQDNPDIYYQPLPEVVPEEQDVRADHDGYQREHVKHDDCLSPHRFVLLGATEWSKNGRLRIDTLPAGPRSGGTAGIGSIGVDPVGKAVDDAQRRPRAPAAAEHIGGHEQQRERSVAG
jgi:hypothetical protein